MNSLILAVLGLGMMNVAHRGLWKEANLPQNTVEAIRAAYEAGAQVVETDFIETESGEIICLHDRKALESMSSLVKDPKTITPEDRQKIDLGEKMKLARPYRIPLLEDVLAVVPKKGGVLQAEIKGYGPTYAKRFDELAKRAKLTEKNFIISSFNFEALKDFHAKYPAYKTLWLGAGVGKEGYDVEKTIARAKDGGFDIVCPGCPTARAAGFTRADADRIRAAGFDFRVYGVNGLEELRYAASLGATGFTCNTFLAAYGWARQVEGVKLLPDFGELIPDDLKGCLSASVKTVGVVIPASVPSHRDYLRCKAWFEYASYRVKEASRLSVRKVAPVEDRVADFEEMWMDPEVDLVFCARGGTGAQDLIDKIDWAKLRARNQRVLGFSNITWLLNTMLREKAGHPISGPSLTQFRYLARSSLDWLAPALAAQPLPAVQLRALRPGAFSGLPCGGHFGILSGMADRGCLPDSTGRVVFLECSARYPKTAEKCLDKLCKAGFFANCAGVVFGDITPGDKKNKALKGAARAEGLAEVERIKREFADKVTCPVYDQYPYGHVPKSFAIDFHREVSVSSEGQLQFEGERVKGCKGERVNEDDVAALSELLAIPSVSMDKDANDRATEWMRNYLESRGVWCAVERFSEDGRKILYAATKEGLKKPDYTIVTHLDVVGAPASQFVPRIENGRLYARGACDTKANAFCAAKALVALNGRASVGCVFASDEEVGGRTTKEMVALGYGEPGRMVVTLDSSSLHPDIAYACKGNGYYRVTAVGKSGHSSRPDDCDNPIYKLAEAALKIRDRFPFQKPGEWGDVASVTIVGGGDSANRIPETAEMTVNVRFVEPDGLERHLRTIAEITGLKTEFIRGTPPGIGPGDAPDLLKFRDALKAAYPERSCNLVRAVAANDSRYFTQFGKPLPKTGMNCDGGHSDNEWCEIADLSHFTQFLIDYLR